MNRRRHSFAAAITAAAAVVAVNVAIPSAAQASTPTPGSTAYSAAAGTGSATLSANLNLTGSLGGLLDALITPIVNTALTPLLSALSGTVNNVVASTLGASSSFSVGAPTQQTTTAAGTFPNETAPSPCSRTSATQPCYGISTGPGLNIPPLVNVGLGLLSGWTEQVDPSVDSTNPMIARASVGSVSVSALPGISGLTNPVISSGLADARSNCPNDGLAGSSKPKTAPSVQLQAGSVSLLGGQVTLTVTNGQVANLIVFGQSYSSLLALPSLTSGPVSVQPFGNAVEVVVSLSPTQILSALNLPSAIVTQLLSYTPTSSVQLALIVGPGGILTTKTASAWGLGIGVDLSGTLSFNLSGLVTATVAIPTGVAGGNNGNLLDLRLAYTTCQSAPIQPGSGGGGGGGGGGTATTPAVPPALV